ncbi:MAG: ASKHA domain-containing protein [Candidatus Omnitrophota bacterium]
MCDIYFPQFKQGKTGTRIHPGLSILDLARNSGVKINAECGGQGKCGKCIVRIEKGKENLNELTHAEKNFKLGANERLACQTTIIRELKDMSVFMKSFGEYEILKSGTEKEVPVNPVFYKKGDKVFKNEEEIDKYQGKIYGLAIDVGTTTLVFDLVNLENGDVIATVAKTNPQISYGNDVISRIGFTLVDEEKGRYFKENERTERVRILQETVVESINSSIKEISERCEEDILRYIYEAVVVGNPTMRNLFFGFDVASLGLIPFEPGHKESVIKKPEEIGLLINSKGRVFGAPLIGGHAGADTVADVLASEIYKNKEVGMVIDIGTNGEIVLGNSERMISASCAAGGAYEGTTISSGCGAIGGAIKQVEIINGRVAYSTIEDKHPIGICGSGLIDLLAELLTHGIMSKTAKIGQDFYVTGKIKISQQDIYQLITAKGGLRTDQDLLMKQYPVDLKNISRIYLAGGFGNFINVKNAMKIGLIPEAEEEKVVKIGNGALEGAREMLLSRQRRETAKEIAKKIEHCKPNETEKDFAYLVAENMYFR